MGISSAPEITHGNEMVIPKNSETETVIVQITNIAMTAFARSFSIYFSYHFLFNISLAMFGDKSISASVYE